jgi:AcrR family transcriptional regulator
MPKRVKRRSYRSELRAASAALTRRAILESARELFVANGYGATTMAAVAGRAKVSLDTVYATVGRKSDLFALLVETAISGVDRAVGAEDRDYVKAIRSAPTAKQKLLIYTQAIGSIASRLAPLHSVLKAAANEEPELARLWQTISRRRAANMRLFAADLASTGELRSDVGVERTADIIWSMNGPEYYTLLVTERGWSIEAFTAWLLDAWCKLLLAPAEGPEKASPTVPASAERPRTPDLGSGKRDASDL